MKAHRLCRLCMFVVFWPVFIQAGWMVESEVVDGGSAGLYNSIALDATGIAQIAYYDATYTDLKLASRGSGYWTGGASDVAGDVGSHCSIAVDSSGVPHVSYYYTYQQTVGFPPFSYTVTRGVLKYIAGASGTPITLDNSTGVDVGKYSAIALNGSGEPRVAYHDATSGDLCYIAKSGSSWGSADSVESGGKGASLAIDSSGYPHISHVDGTELRYVYWNGSSWVGTTVEDYQVEDERTSIALDSNGYPHIVYVNVEGLRYVYWDGSDWNDELVHWIPGTGTVGVSSPSLTLNSDDEPFISYHGNLWGDLAVVVAVRNGVDDWSMPAWLLEGTTPGGQTSIAVDTNDILYVSFHDATTGDLGYATVMEDSDGDWLPDWWEMKYFQDLDEEPDGDPDEDSISNNDEYWGGTDPTVSNNGGGESWDRDGDGLSNDDETNIYGTDPDDPDSDDDGLPDGVEIGYHLFWGSFEEAAFDERWSNGGDQPWVIDSSIAQNESQSARSGAITHGQSSYLELEAVLLGEGTMSFWHRTSSEADSDYLRFSTNGVSHSDYSGTTDWTITYIEGVPAGTNTLRWTYEKDSSGSAGDDAVWLDAVYIGVTATGTSPTNSDCDADGLLDGAEVNIYGTNPLVADSDDDGLSDSDEVNVYGTDPTLADTDLDLMPDGWEVTYTLNPTNGTDAAVDMEPDGLSNLEEYQNGTDPRDEDSDNDLMPDGWEVTYTLNPTNGTDAAVDIEPDGLSNLEEYQNGTDPRDADSDNDLMPDSWEVTHTLNPTNIADAAVDIEPDGLSNLEEYQNGTDPRDADSDNDLMPDGWEVTYSLNPANGTDAAVDIEPDGLINLVEYQNGTDPRNKDSDADGLEDAEEINVIGSSPLLQDSDADGLPDGQETSVVGMVGFGFEDGALPAGVVLTGHTNWYVAATDTVQGQYAARSGDMSADFLYSQLSYTMETAAGTGSFWYSVLVSPNDEFEFFVNGSRKLSTYASPWTNFTFNVSEGTNTFTWKFQTRSGGVRSGNEAALIDQLMLPVAGTGTSPTNSDSDADGLMDGEELNTYHTDPTLADTDSDGLSDGDEVNIHGTLPLNPDTDEDGLSDGDEVNTYTTLPLDDDTDNDGLTDGDEVNIYGSNPKLVDSDGDTLNDGYEVNTLGTNPAKKDTDDDGLDDNVETKTGVYVSPTDTGTDPTDPDADDDGALDGVETDTGVWVSSSDTGTDPFDPDTDGDNLSDGAETHTGIYVDQLDAGCDPHNTDSDNDGLSDGLEVVGVIIFTDSFESGSFTSKWSTWGTMNGWAVVDSESSNGLHSAQSDVVSYGWSSTLTLNMGQLCSGVRFAYKLDDFFNVGATRLSFNAGNGPVEFTGLSDWASESFSVTNKSAFSWTVLYSIEAGNGNAWIDNVEVQGMPTGTDPNKADTDSDGLNDKDELDTYNTDPLDPDTDNDGLDDGDELNRFFPFSESFETNAVPDGWTTGGDSDWITETTDVYDGTNSIVSGTLDKNQDSWIELSIRTWTNDLTFFRRTYGSDGEHLALSIDGDTKNTTYDYSDWGQVSTALTAGDHVIRWTFHRSSGNGNWSGAGDRGLIDLVELTRWDGTDLNDPDSDDDGVNDGDEVHVHGTQPNEADTDRDGMPDGYEVDNQLNPLVDDTAADADSDGLNNGDEHSYGSDPQVKDSDSDGIEDGTEVHTYGSDPMDTDSDDDGLEDGDELTYTTGLMDDDSDDDGVKDGAEVHTHGTEPTIFDTDNDGLSDGDELISMVYSNSFEYEYFDYKWTTGGDVPWELSTYWPYDGTQHAFSSLLPPGKTNTLSLTINVLDGNIIFYESLDMKIGGRALFYINGVQQEQYYPTTQIGWEQKSYPVSQGTNTFTWVVENWSSESGYFSIDKLSVPMLPGTSALDDDSDDDGVKDGLEVNLYHCNPLSTDTDNDGLTDGQEVNTYGTNPNLIDTDKDGMSDGWETDNTLMPTNNTDAAVDIEPDGLTNLEEYQNGTNPRVADTDSDGMLDGYEVNNGLNPLLDDADLDSDSDGLSNIEEHNAGSNPQSSDTDNDLMPDGWEVSYSLMPTNNADAAVDIEPDGLTNLEEYQNGTNPRVADTDSDGMSDGWEIDNALMPTNNADAAVDIEPDGLTNLEEFQNGTNPGVADTDSDSMPDGWEVSYSLMPTNNADAAVDIEPDGLTNLEEYQNGTNPRVADTDNDGLNDGYEVNTSNTDPTDEDTDGDGMIDGWEWDHFLDPRVDDASGDADNDGMTNLQEAQAGTDPQSTDSDSDGMTDGWEADHSLDPAVNDAGGDPDNDGYTNRHEFDNGTDPQVANDTGNKSEFFRIVSDSPTVITGFRPDGWLTWSNSVLGATCRVERATSLVGEAPQPASLSMGLKLDLSGGDEPTWITNSEVIVTNLIMDIRCFDPEAKPDMAFIPAGYFLMGDHHNEGEADELPVHSVFVSAFCIGKYEVRYEEVLDVMQWAYDNGRVSNTFHDYGSGEFLWSIVGYGHELLVHNNNTVRWDGVHYELGDTAGTGYPAHVTWFGAIAYCNFLSEIEGLDPCYDLSDCSCDYSKNGYRLPTEAEWERAARGGLYFRFAGFDTITHSQANYYADPTWYDYDYNPASGYHPDYDENCAPVGSFDSNGYGLFDMTGNILEWCGDWYDEDYYSSSPVKDPRGPSPLVGVERVLRGGSYAARPDQCRVSMRFAWGPTAPANGGFRVVRSAE